MKWDIYKLKKIGAVLKRAWHDPVGSKLIAGAISIVLLTVLASVSRVSSPEGVPEKTSVPVPVSPAGTAIMAFGFGCCQRFEPDRFRFLAFGLRHLGHNENRY
jgi:hypothetical protein